MGTAAKMRQFTGPLGQHPYFGDAELTALVELLARTRPWTAQPEVARQLLAWAGADATPLDCVDVAGELARLGTLESAMSETGMAVLTRDMLLAVLNGWPIWDFQWLYEFGEPLPLRTRQRHKAEGLAYVRGRARRERELRDLIAGGRSEAAARRWMQRWRQRNPGKPIPAAPPPQRRG